MKCLNATKLKYRDGYKYVYKCKYWSCKYKVSLTELTEAYIRYNCFS